MPNKKSNQTDQQPRSTSSRSDSRPYKSIYKEGYITKGAYISEIIFEKRSIAFNSGKLPENFWNDKKYTGQFKGQVIAANRLLKKYRDSSIIKALRDNRANFILKLQNEKLVPLIEEYEKNYKEKEITKEEKIMEKPRKPLSKKKNLFGEL
jgi:hypothetical protein